jgi:hypothetical protein
MKLRLLVLLLLAANLGFFGWTQGWLDGLAGTRAHADREPERLLRQIDPQSVRVLPPPEAARAMAGAMPDAADACLEAGPFNAGELAAAEAALQTALPGGEWARRSVGPGAAPSLLRIEHASPSLAAQLAQLPGEVKGQPLASAFRPCATPPEGR